MHTVRYFGRVRPGVEALELCSTHAFPRHAHDQFGLGIIVSGVHRSWSGRGSVEAEAGDFICVQPGEVHDGLPLAGAPRDWQMLYFAPGQAAPRRAASDQGTLEVARPAGHDPALARDFGRLFAALTAPGSDPLAADEAMAAVFARLRRRWSGRPIPREPPPCAVARARARLDAAVRDGLAASVPVPVRLDELAALEGVSRFQLLRGFVRAWGITPHAYLLQRRGQLARRLLARGLLPAEVAAAAGFADQSHLTRVFRRQFGVTPGRYRVALAG